MNAVFPILSSGESASMILTSPVAAHGVASGAITLGSNDGSRRSRGDRTIHRRIHEWIRATREHVSWRTWQTTQDLRHHQGVDSATIISVAPWRLAGERQHQRKAVSALVEREEVVAIQDVIQSERRSH